MLGSVFPTPPVLGFIGIGVKKTAGSGLTGGNGDGKFAEMIRWPPATVGSATPKGSAPCRRGGRSGAGCRADRGDRRRKVRRNDPLATCNCWIGHSERQRSLLSRLGPGGCNFYRVLGSVNWRLVGYECFKGFQY